MGIGNNINQNLPVKVNVANVMKIVMGNDFSMLLSSNFTCFGKLPSNSLICSGNGICSNHDVCSCGFEFNGPECQLTSCFGFNSTDPNVCSGNGKCIRKNDCQCNYGYGGELCSINKFNSIGTITFSTGLNNVRKSFN